MNHTNRCVSGRQFVIIVGSVKVKILSYRYRAVTNFDPNHAFLSSIEAEMITFLPKKAAIFWGGLLWPPYKYFNMAPLPELIVRPQRPLILKMVLLSTL